MIETFGLVMGWWEDRFRKARIGWESQSVDANGQVICQDCADQGKADIVCALCGVKQQSSESQIAIGYGYRNVVDHLCKKCYETVPARLWAETLKRLENEHKFDDE